MVDIELQKAKVLFGFHFSFVAPIVVKGYGEAQMKASDWSKHYANHLVTSLIDSCQSKWSNQNGESSENRR